MKNVVRWCGVVVVATLIVGCEKQPEVRQAAKPLATESSQKGFPLLDPPSQSEPAALVTVKKMIAAHTLNKPEVIDQLKGLTITREGYFTLPDPAVNGKAIKYDWVATWPDRSRYQWHGIAPVPMTIRICDQRVAQDVNGMPISPPLAESRYQDHFRDNYGNWLQFLVPLTDPKTIVTTAADFQILDQTLKGLRVWHVNAAQAIVYYDPKTFLVKRIAYDGRTDGVPCLYEHSLADHKAMSGFMIAEKV
jgi:hypothetical protein